MRRSVDVIVLGAALVVVGAIGAALGAREWALWSALRKVRPTTVDRLVAAAANGRFDGRTVAVEGIAASGPAGLLRSSVNDEDCIWHRHVVHRRDITYRQTDKGMRQRRSLSKQVADRASEAGFLLRGASTNIEIQPKGLRMHAPLARTTRVLPGMVGQPFPEADSMMVAAQRLFWHREWILRAGGRLLVLAEVRSYGQRLSLSKPARGPHVLSTRSLARLRWQTGAAVVGGLGLGPVAVLAGTAMLIVHFVL